MYRPLAFAVAFAVAWPVAASAQTSSLFGNRSINQGGLGTTPTVGGRTGGTGSSSGMFSGGSRTGQTGSSFGSGSATAGGSAFGSGSSFGSDSALGSGSSLGGGMTGQQGFQLGTVTPLTGTGPFVGRSDNAGRFVGNQRVGQQAAMGAIQALQGLQSFQRGGGFNNRSDGQQDAERLPIRPTQRIAFEFTPTTPAIAVERVSSRFSGLTDRRPELAGVTFETDDDGRVILRGTVATEEAGQLAAALVRLEPGVREVVNELAIESEATP